MLISIVTEINVPVYVVVRGDRLQLCNIQNCLYYGKYVKGCSDIKIYYVSFKKKKKIDVVSMMH